MGVLAEVKVERGKEGASVDGQLLAVGIWSILTFYLLGRPPSWIDPLLLDNPPSPRNGSPPPIEDTLLLGLAPLEMDGPF